MKSYIENIPLLFHTDASLVELAKLMKPVARELAALAPAVVTLLPVRALGEEPLVR